MVKSVTATKILKTPTKDHRTASTWDFREDERLQALFNKLKPADNRFVDITSLIKQVLKDIEDVDDATPENRISCIEVFIKACKDYLPIDLRNKMR